MAAAHATPTDLLAPLPCRRQWSLTDKSPARPTDPKPNATPFPTVAEYIGDLSCHLMAQPGRQLRYLAAHSRLNAFHDRLSLSKHYRTLVQPFKRCASTIIAEPKPENPLFSFL
jgi:hypothetical protein